MKLDLVGPSGSACAAAVSAAGTWLAMASDAALQLFGVPLPVVLAALTGACGARVFLPAAQFAHAFMGCVFWTSAGAFCPQLVLWLISQWLTGAPPSGVLAGIALITSALGQRAAPILWERGGAALQRWLDGLFNKGGQ